MDYIKKTINVEEQVTGGARCSNPVIVWDDPLCAGIKCIKNNGRVIDVVIPDDCPEKCFWVTYYCNDYCTNCEPIRLKICPCDVDTDCESCAYCDPIYGICVSKCDEGEFCTDFNTCVECDETHPCPEGKQCVGGKCVCPPERPYIDDDGNCRPCLDDTCPEGQVCTPDGCQDPVCPEGHWLASEEKCVQCINTGHCDPGECCNPITHVCECCEGFVRDPITQQCVSAPCTEDKECPQCTHCQTGVGCVPDVCPDGKVCIPGEGCVDECNCSNPDCLKPNHACVAYSANVCYCKDCTGSCANGEPCGEGCYCDDDLQCKANPCSNVSCTNGSECGQGCGCNQQTHQCEPCSSAACGNECDNLLGCECPNGTSCQDVQGCDGPCDGYGSCPFPCTCVGGQCVPCSDFSCETNDCSDRPECICTDTGCEGDDNFCQDTFEAEDFSCGVTATLAMGQGCMCPGVTVYVTPHVISRQTTGNNEKRYSVSLALRLAKGFGNSWDQIKTLHLLDETQYQDIADNDTPTSGTLDLTITEFYQVQAWVNGAWVNQGGVTARVVTPPSGSISFAGIARKQNVTFTANKIGTGKNIMPNVSQEKILRYDVEVKANTFKFPNNCEYTPEVLPTMMLDSGQFKSTTDSLDAQPPSVSFTDLFINAPTGNYNLGGLFVIFENIMSASSRDPLFTWFRSEDNVYTDSDIIRKLYIKPDSFNVYVDSLYGPKNFTPTKQNLVSPEGRVFGDMYYKVTNDCACNLREQDFGSLKWCSPDSLAIASVTFSQCNKKVVIASDITQPCVTNWSLSEFTLHPNDSSAAFKSRHQAKYHLMIELEDGTKVDRPYIWRQTGVPSAGLYHEPDNAPIKSYTQTFASAIISLKLVLRYGTSDIVVCEWDKAIPTVVDHIPTHTTVCETTKIKYRFNKAANQIQTYQVTGGGWTDVSGVLEITANHGSEVTVYFTFSGGFCPTTVVLNESCCDTLSVTMGIEYTDDGNNNVRLTAVVTGGVPPYSVKYYQVESNGNRVQVGNSSNQSNNFLFTLTNPQSGNYVAVVTDNSGTCTKESAVSSITPRNRDDYEVTIVPTFNGCTYTGNVAISIPQQPDILASKIFHKIDSGAEQFFTVTSLMITNGFHLIPAIGHTVSLVRLEIPNQAAPPTSFALSGSATVPSNLNANIPSVSSFTLNGSAAPISICSGDDVLIEVHGSPNALVSISGIPQIQLDGSGVGSSIQNPVTTTTYTITAITSADGGCPGTAGVGLSRTVQVVPLPTVTVVTDICNGAGTLRTITFSNLTIAKDQNNNVIPHVGTTVTVNPLIVTTVKATYTSGACSTTIEHPVVPCGAPVITGTVTAPDTICAGQSVLVTVSGVTGGTAPYSYNYYTNFDYNEIYIPASSKSFALIATTTIFVRVKDAFGNIGAIGDQIVTVAATPTPNIVPIIGQPGVTEVTPNVYEIFNSITEAVFTTEVSYATYSWLVTVLSGTYAGVLSGSGPTFAIDVALVTGTIELAVTVVTESGCVGSEEVTMSVTAAPVLLGPGEILFSTDSYRLFKVLLTTGSVGVPVELCGPGNPAFALAIRGNGDVIGLMSPSLYELSPLLGCGNSLITTPAWSVIQGIGMITADKVVGMIQPGILQTYDLATSTLNTNHYTIVDGSNFYTHSSDLVRIGSSLYAITSRYIAGVFQDHTLIRFTLDGSGNVTAFANVGPFPNPAFAPIALASDGVDAYLIFGGGTVYHLNLVTPNTSVLIGTIITPGLERILNAANNF